MMLRKALALTALLLIATGCAEPDRTVHPASPALLAQRTGYARLDSLHRVSLADDTEPGQRLLILGRLVRLEDGRPIQNHPIRFYHADHDGSYDEATPGQEDTARIQGTVQTDSLGRFLVSTVMPGDYGSSTDNRHIHMSVAGARPEAYDFFFSQYINAGLRRWANGSDQAVVLDLTQMEGDMLLAAGEVRAKAYGATRNDGP